jgi:hypothetical protein
MLSLHCAKAQLQLHHIHIVRLSDLQYKSHIRIYDPDLGFLCEFLEVVMDWHGLPV